MEVHIDLSGKYAQLGKPTAIALVNEQGILLKGVLIESKVKKALVKRGLHFTGEHVQKLHARIVGLLLEEFLSHATRIVICDDHPPFQKLQEQINSYFMGHPLYTSTLVESVKEYRRKENDDAATSLADRAAKLIRKNAKHIRNEHRQHDCFRKLHVMSFQQLLQLYQK
ncbi:MAG: hypothetical protein OXR66_01945 [Candidatus Woesearchaeota archaeon]|nr:hypothetical protein [Candidatus Woesearchaeota archaeon]